MGDPLPIVGCICWEYVSTYKFCTLEKKGTCRLSWQGVSHGYLREWVWQTLLMLTNISKSLPFPFSMNELIPIMWPVLTSGVWPEMTCEHFRVGVHFSPCFFFFFFFLFSLSLFRKSWGGDVTVWRNLYLPGSPSDCLEQSPMANSIEHVD